MNTGRNYLQGATSERFIDQQRDEYKQRTGFSDSQYYKVVSLSLKFYKQAVENKVDIEGNDLSAEEVEICEVLISKMNKEMELHQEKFYQDRDE